MKGLGFRRGGIGGPEGGAACDAKSLGCVTYGGKGRWGNEMEERGGGGAWECHKPKGRGRGGVGGGGGGWQGGHHGVYYSPEVGGHPFYGRYGVVCEM